MGRSRDVRPQATENYLGKVGSNADVIEFTLVADTNIYADNDVLAISALTGGQLARVAGGCFTIVSASLFDGDDQGTEVYLYFTTNATTPGTINGALSAADTVFDDIQGYIDFVTYEDLINSQVCHRKNLQMLLQCADGATDMYCFAVVRSGTPTYTASGLKVKLGIIRH